MKYIIEIKPEYEDSFKGVMILGAKDSNLFVDTLAVENLEQYTPVDVEKIYDKACTDGYNRGLEDGKQAAVGAAELREKLEYQRGLNDAWEAAKKIALMDTETSENVTGYFGLFRIMDNLTASEVIAKLKAYEEKQKADDPIIAGDEVIYNGTTKCVVVTPETDEKYASLFDCNGIHYSADHRECKKTGRHFAIGKILEDMKA